MFLNTTPSTHIAVYMPTFSVEYTLSNKGKVNCIYLLYAEQ